jgi:hypothetical protein
MVTGCCAAAAKTSPVLVESSVEENCFILAPDRELTVFYNL